MARSLSLKSLSRLVDTLGNAERQLSVMSHLSEPGAYVPHSDGKNSAGDLAYLLRAPVIALVKQARKGVGESEKGWLDSALNYIGAGEYDHALSNVSMVYRWTRDAWSQRCDDERGFEDEGGIGWGRGDREDFHADG